LWLPGGRRLTGWLDSRSKVAVHLPEPDKTSADSDIYWDAEWAPIKDVDGENGAQVAVYGDAVEIGCARYFPDAARMLAAQLLAGAALADNAGGARGTTST
ncbi:MAG TPA: hypothetical protein VHA37_00875, partial [Candidatus Saccharimonadales bacterium]|nr:hypothetical protein [Candidatus Saccharimonadales bacterium]